MASDRRTEAMRGFEPNHARNSVRVFGERWRLAVFVAATWLLTASLAKGQERSIVRRIDHILITSSEPDKLFSLLSETLQLPVVSPLRRIGPYFSGIVWAGNVMLEVGADADAHPSRIAGFALEPEPLTTALAELELRGISHGAPAPFTPDGSRSPLWTLVDLPSVSNAAVYIFLCEYQFDMRAYTGRALERFRSGNGGPLGLKAVVEIQYGSLDVAKLRQNLQNLLHPFETSSAGVWPLASGPAIRVIASDKDVLQNLVIDVASLSQARRFLSENGLLGSEQPGQLKMGGPQLQGLTLTLVERP